jgi:hypothetical protein
MADCIDKPSAVADDCLRRVYFTYIQTVRTWAKEGEAIFIKKEPAGEGNALRSKDPSDLVQIVLGLLLKEVSEYGGSHYEGELLILDRKRLSEPIAIPGSIGG